MAFTCPDCKRTSHNPNDEKYRYCGACHVFFPEQEINEPAEVVVISQLIIEARGNMAAGAVQEYPARHARHWRAVIAWLQAHLPPAHSTVAHELPCHQCLDLGVFPDPQDAANWIPCTCPVGQHLGDLSA